MVYRLVSLLINLLETAIILSAILSWFPIRGIDEIKRVLDSIVSPILEPIQKVLYRYVNLGGIDISPIIALLILSILRKVLFILIW